MPLVFAIEVTKERRRRKLESECQNVVTAGMRLQKPELILKCRRNQDLSKTVDTERTRPVKLLLMVYLGSPTLETMCR